MLYFIIHHTSHDIKKKKKNEIVATDQEFVPSFQLNPGQNLIKLKRVKKVVQRGHNLTKMREPINKSYERSHLNYICLKKMQDRRPITVQYANYTF